MSLDFVGDAAKLQVDKVVTVVIPNVPGFKITGDDTQPCVASMRCRHFLVVDGLDPDIIILSAR